MRETPNNFNFRLPLKDLKMYERLFVNLLLTLRRGWQLMYRKMCKGTTKQIALRSITHHKSRHSRH